jgi:hypothetical protein
MRLPRGVGIEHVAVWVRARGDEEFTLAGRRITGHRVREVSIGTQGVYTLWWYGDQGMGVRRFHTTTWR